MPRDLACSIMSGDASRSRGAAGRVRGGFGESMTDIIRVDLHCHSALSDGDHSPEQVARRLAGAGVVWAALTDHNTLAGQRRFREAAEKRGVRVVTGLEIDVLAAEGPLHLLAYGFDVRDDALTGVITGLRRPLRSTARYLMRRARSLGERAASAQRPAVPPAPHRPPDVATALRLIHDAGGIAALAHPVAGLESVAHVEALVARLRSQGLDGLEVFYKPCGADVQAELLALADRCDLLALGGSDFHGHHHAFGATLGVDMPRERWDRLARRLGLGDAPGARSAVGRGARAARRLGER